MNPYEDNIPLSKEEVARIKDIFLKIPFEQLKFHKYFFRPHTSDYSEVSRHGVTIEEVNKFYNQPNLISRGSKRNSQRGYHYAMCYGESEGSYVKIIYLFDEKPIQILNAMRIFRNLENAVKRKYGIRF